MSRWLCLALVLIGLESNAATYYVKVGGNDSADGLSDTNAWSSLSKITALTGTTSDKVYLKAGGTWNIADANPSFAVRWSGVVGNRGVLGAYYMNGGTETVGLGGNARPVIHGNFNTARSPFSTAMLDVSGSYITVENLRIENTVGTGIRVNNPYAIVQYCVVDDIGHNGIMANQAPNATIEHNRVSDHNIGVMQGAGGVPTDAWGSGIVIYGSGADNAVIRYNEVGPGWGEGINTVKGPASALFEYNLVYDNQSVQLYCESSRNNIVRYNVVLGSASNSYHSLNYGGKTWAGSGLGINPEFIVTGETPGNHKIYGNIVVGTYACVRTYNSTQYGNSPGIKGDQSYIYGNSCIDNYNSIAISADKWMPIDLANNLFVHTPGSTIGSVAWGVLPQSTTWGNCRVFGNFWSTVGGLHSSWRHSSDVVGDPRLAHASGFQALTAPAGFDTSAWFRLLEDSPAISSARDAVSLHLANTGQTDNALQNGFGDGTEFNVADAADPATPIAVTLADQETLGTWDFGAWVYQTPPDVGPPTITLIERTPAANAAYASGTTSVTLTVRVTDGSCRYALGSDLAWASMTAMSCSGSAPDVSCTASHGSLTDGTTYQDYFRCHDAAGNELGGDWLFRVLPIPSGANTNTASSTASWR